MICRIRKILIVNLAVIGDISFSIPALHLIRNKVLSAKLYLAVAQRNNEYAKSSGFKDELFELVV